MKQTTDRYEWASFLVAKLERLSADSVWAHRASGVRGALLRAIDDYDQRRMTDSLPSGDLEAQKMAQLDRLITAAFDILEKAAKEIPVPDDWIKEYRR